MGRNIVLRRLDLAADNPVLLAMKGRLDRVLNLIEKRLGEADYFAGREFTAADIITVFSLTTLAFSCQSTSLPLRISFDISGA